MKILFNILYYIYVIVSAPILYLTAALIFLLTYPFDKKRVVLHKFSVVWALLYFWVSPAWRIKYSGKENRRKGQRYIIVANHQSMLDIALMYKLPNVFRWVSKREVLKIPFIGWLLSLHGDVLIKRGSAASAKQMITACRKWLDKGVDIAIFPEGTRAKDGKVHDFKEGAFLLAKMAKTAILPVVLNGSYEVLPPKGMSLKPKQTFDLHILPEISAEEVANTPVKEMTKWVHNLIASEHRNIAPHLYENKADKEELSLPI